MLGDREVNCCRREIMCNLVGVQEQVYVKIDYSSRIIDYSVHVLQNGS